MMPSLRQRNLTLGLALVLALIVVVAGGLTSYRKLQDFQPLGFSAEARAASWLILEVHSDSTGLEPGDSLLLVNGDGPARVVDLRSALAGRGTSELVVLRSDELQTVSYSPPPLAIDFSYLILALTACAYLLIGFYTLLRDQRRPALLFFVWCVVSAAVYLVTVSPPYDLLDRVGYVLEGLARIVVGPLTLHLFTVFPRPLAPSRRLAKAVAFFYLPAAFLALLQLDLIVFGGTYLFAGNIAAALPIVDTLELAHLAAFALLAAAALTWRLFQTTEPEPQRQAIWLALGTVVGYLPFIAFYLTPRILGAEWPALPDALAVLPLALVPITFSYAILRFKLWDIGVIVRDTLSLSLTILLGISGFALANLLIERLVPADLALGRNILVFVSGLMVAGLMIPTRRSVGRSLERLQYGTEWQRRRALLDFGREILEERDLERLFARLSEAISDSLDIERTNLLLPGPGGRLEPRRPLSGSAPSIPESLFDESFWARPVSALSAVAVADENTARQRLYAAGYRYAFPLQGRSHNLGVFLAGYKADGIPLSSDDLDLLRGLLNQAALAIENAQLLEKVNEQLSEVVRLKEFNQGIIDSSPAGIAVLGSDRRFLSANRTFAELTGRSANEIVGQHLEEVLPDLELPQPEEGIRETALTRGETRRHLQLSTAHLLESSQESGRVIVLMDVSQRVAMQQALVEKDRLAALGMLAAGVAHEVNTPITGISSYAQMMLSDLEETDPNYGLLRKIEKQTFRAARIVNNLLNFARKQDGAREEVDLVPLLDECLDLLRERLTVNGIALAWHKPATTAVVTGNDGELQQVFTNLLLNAIDAMAGGGTLTVEVTVEGDWIRVGVEDTGIGINTDDLGTVFEPFFSTKLQQGGTGLGLSISNDIVKNHGGVIRVISNPGSGSRFMVELPRHSRARA